MHHNFSHSITEGHLGCFRILAFMNTAAVNHSCAGFYVDISFQLIGVNTKGHNC